MKRALTTGTWCASGSRLPAIGYIARNDDKGIHGINGARRSFLGDLAIKYLFIIELNGFASGVQMFSIDSISCDCFDYVVR